MKPSQFIDTLILGIATVDVPYVVRQFTSHLDKMPIYLEHLSPKDIILVTNAFIWATNQQAYTSEMARQMEPVYVLLKGSENVAKREYEPESDNQNDTDVLGHLVKKLRKVTLLPSSDLLEIESNLGKHHLSDAEEYTPKRQKKENVFTPDKKRREAIAHDNSSDIALHTNKKARKRISK